MDRLWGNGFFCLVSAVAVSVSASWFLVGRDPSDLPEVTFLLIPAAVGAFAFVDLFWPIGEYAVWLIRREKGKGDQQR